MSAKLLKVEAEQELQNQKYSLIQEDNSSLREEVRRLRKENRQQAATVQELNQQASAADRALWRKLKEREDVLTQMSADIDHLKQERDTYKDRFQRSLRDA